MQQSIRHWLTICIAIIVCGCSTVIRAPKELPPTTTVNTEQMYMVQSASENNKEIPPETNLDPSVLTGSLTWRYFANHTIEIGSVTAPIVLKIHTNTSCKYCQQFMREQFRTLLPTYVKTNQVRLQFIPYMLPTYTSSNVQYNAIYCASTVHNSEEFFIRMASTMEDVAQSIPKIASELNIDQKALTACMENADITSELEKNTAQAAQNGIQFIPHFTLPNHAISGLPTWAELDGTINLETNKL